MEEVFGILMASSYRLPRFFEESAGLQAGISTYIKVMGDITDLEMTEALYLFLRTPNDYGGWPRPSHLLACSQERQESAVDIADETWGLVLKAVSARGFCRPPTKEDPVHPDQLVHSKMMAGIEAVGGWKALGMLTNAGLVSGRAAYRTGFRSCSKREQIASEVSALKRLAQGPLTELSKTDLND